MTTRLRRAAPVLAGLLLVAACSTAGKDAEKEKDKDAGWTEPARLDALARAVVWQPPPAPIESADLAATPGALPGDVRCRFKVDTVRGTTPKFECQLPDGETVKVKYTGAEPYGEVAASRLLRAVGFGADRVFFVERLRCYGCPRYPFPTLKLVTLTGADKAFARGLDFDSAVDFDWVSVERKTKGEYIETDTGRGWAWHELARVSTASRTHADALKLMAIFLAHWDNKPENQRLICLSGGPDADGRCHRPFAMLQDVGGTFGPRKVNLDGWRSAPIWKDRAACSVTMESMPHDGATFVTTTISEPGRRFLAERLTKLDDRQIESLFRGARFDQHDAAIADWAATFKSRVQAIATGPECPKGDG